MKNLIKISTIFLLLVVVSCGSNSKDDLKYNAQEEIGWIQFPDNYPDVIQVNTEAQPTFVVGVDVQVPVVSEDFTISYTLVPVSGLNPNELFTNSGQIISPAGQSSISGPNNGTSSVYTYLANITFDTAAIPLLSQEMVFDIVLNSTSNSNITVGLAGTNIPTTQRVRIVCSNPEELPADYFVGDYMIEDVVANIGPGNGTSNFAPSVVSISVDPFDPNVRRFSVVVLPAFTGGVLQPVALSFGSDDRVLLSNVATGIGCTPGVPYIYAQQNTNNSFWDICNEDSVVISYTEDPNGSCGGPFNSSFSLTKI